MGLLEQALLVGDGAGEGAAHVAEQLRLEEPLRDRPAVDRHERPLGPRTVAVDRAGDELLAGARLAGHQHRRVGGAGEGDLLVDGEHRAAAAHEAVGHEAEGASDGSGSLPPARAPGERALDDLGHLADVDGLAHEVERAGLHRLERRLEASRTR
ncbi:MAG: hypothetical protein U0599_28455 [Vicinamibacteria bacterium]